MIPNLQTRYGQFRDHKKSEIVQKEIELSINSNTERSQIWINAYISQHLCDMFYDSKTQLIQFNHQQKNPKKMAWEIYRSDE